MTVRSRHPVWFFQAPQGIVAVSGPSEIFARHVLVKMRSCEMDDSPLTCLGHFEPVRFRRKR